MGKDSAVGGVTQWERTVQWEGHTLKEDSAVGRSPIGRGQCIRRCHALGEGSAVGGVMQWEKTVQWEGSRNERGQCSGRS